VAVLRLLNLIKENVYANEPEPSPHRAILF
jgi:hypothetical protein